MMTVRELLTSDALARYLAAERRWYEVLDRPAFARRDRWELRDARRALVEAETALWAAALDADEVRAWSARRGGES